MFSVDFLERSLGELSEEAFFSGEQGATILLLQRRSAKDKATYQENHREIKPEPENTGSF